ncbi:hypothetical protein CEXT_275051 [Caerostris extrusa]|uniref:Uncharacterized protein n=1 Tax=Caerostris extrusa TaxID=172846 RepID=A0AAV4UWK3_CAEEX|nr:hypothetical protein CEXT_275051 [Caerostris extrusa]
MPHSVMDSKLRTALGTLLGNLVFRLAMDFRGSSITQGLRFPAARFRSLNSLVRGFCDEKGLGGLESRDGF